MPERLSNWNGSHDSEPARLISPSTEGEIAEIVKGASTFPSPVRAAGHLHSLNECIEADGGTQLRMDNFRKIELHLEATPPTITVGAGISLKQIAQVLLPDHQLPVTPEIGNATAGSMACCGTKDSSIAGGPGQVNSAVVGMRYVDATGQIRDVTERGDAAHLRVLRSSYGLLGIVTEVTFRVEPITVIVFDYEPMELRPLPSLEEVVGEAEGFLAFMEPYAGTMVVERRTVDRSANPRITAVDQLQCAFRSLLWETGGSLLAAKSRPSFPLALVPGADLLATSGLIGLTVDKSIEKALDPLHFRARRADTTIEFEGNRPHYFDFAFWAFPRSRWSRAVPEYLEFCQRFLADRQFRVSLPTEVYFVRRDDSSLLSFCPEEDAFTLDMVHHRVEGQPFDPRWMEMNEAFNRQIAVRHGARPLFNQTKQLDRATVLASGSAARWKTFSAIVGREDPAGRFRNRYFRDLL